MKIDKAKLNRIAKQVVLVANVVAILLLWLCCLSTSFHPDEWPKMALMGLLFPGFVILDLIFILIWLPFNYKRAWIPLAGLLPCLGYVIDYCPLSFHSEAPSGSIKVMTWNTDNFGMVSKDREESKKIILEYLKNCDADIICLQETSTHQYPDSFENYLDSIGYERDDFNGRSILTRFHILEKDTIAYTSKIYTGCKGNGSKWYKLQMGNDTILLINNHLESNHLEDKSKKEYLESIEDPEIDKIKESSQNLLSKLKMGVSYRGPQVDSLVQFIDKHKDMPIVFCGDLNDTPISYTYQRISSRLTSAFRQSGSGIGISYNQKGFWVRIDHIFVSNHWRTYNTHIDTSIKSSDHYPLISWLKME
ncbi:MAG: endonuclease/exonuclease/phosphatase family protein [Bacteroidaceae bacterium]|nr:endonuclease/exonuclease/phosphatase family protein [Bacteroidaceae bacterium]